MSPKYESVSTEPQLTRPRASTAGEPVPEQAPPAKPSKESEALVTVTVAIPREVRTALKVAAAQSGVTIQQAADEAFRMWLAVRAESKRP